MFEYSSTFIHVYTLWKLMIVVEAHVLWILNWNFFSHFQNVFKMEFCVRIQVTCSNNVIYIWWVYVSFSYEFICDWIHWKLFWCLFLSLSLNRFIEISCNIWSHADKQFILKDNFDSSVVHWKTSIWNADTRESTTHFRSAFFCVLFQIWLKQQIIMKLFIHKFPKHKILKLRLKMFRMNLEMDVVRYWSRAYDWMPDYGIHRLSRFGQTGSLTHWFICKYE